MLIAAGHAFDWHLHVAWLLILPVLVGGYLWAVRRRPEWAATGRQQVLFVLRRRAAGGRRDVAAG